MWGWDESLVHEKFFEEQNRDGGGENWRSPSEEKLPSVKREETICDVDVALVIINNNTMLPFQCTNEGTASTKPAGNS